MKVIILAAGRGSRLAQKTKDKPKCMVELFGRSLLDMAIETLEKAGIERKDIGIVTGYKKELIQVDGVTCFYNADWERTNMFVSLTMAGEWLENNDCIVCYSDIVFSPNAVKLLAQSRQDVAVTCYTGYWELWQKRFENPLEDLETFKVNEDSYITEIGRRTTDRSDIEGQYMGLIRFSKAAWHWVLELIRKPLPKPLDKLDMTTLLNALVESGYPVYAIPTDELWLECDTENDIAVYERMLGKET